jgi:hypothetical protein
VSSEDEVLIPNWVPPAVVEVARELLFLSSAYVRLLADEQWDAYVRLLTDERMRTVWVTLTRRKRTPGRPYEFPAAKGQSRGLQELFITACGYSSTDGLLPATSANELEAARQRCFQLAQRLEDVLQELRECRIGHPENLSAVQSLINECKSTAARFSHLGLTIVDRERGDMFLRSFLAELTKFTQGTFGSPLYRIVATIANIAFGRDDVTAEQVRGAVRDAKKSGLPRKSARSKVL